MGMQVYNYPVVNHGRMRGLLQRLQSRLLSLQGERAALQQQLTELPLDTEDSQAPLRSRVHPCSCFVFARPLLALGIIFGSLAMCLVPIYAWLSCSTLAAC